MASQIPAPAPVVISQGPAPATPLLPPIVFNLPRFPAPDVNLVVFDQPFHVHSQVLKTQSNFFYRFLDSPEKDDRTSVSGMKYEWVTEMDADGTWGLVALNKTNIVTAISPTIEAKFSPGVDKIAFEKLLLALYSEPFDISSLPELFRMVDLADYYCCISRLSKSITASLPRTSFFVETIPEEPANILAIATKLRNATIFREAMIFIVGDWPEGIPNSYRYCAIHDIRETKVKIMAMRKRLELELVVANLLDLLDRVTPKQGGSEVEQDMRQYLGAAYTAGYDETKRDLPAFLRDYREKIGPIDEFVLNTMNVLMKNNSVVVATGGRSGREPWEEVFLCTEVAEEDLPWDITTENF